MKNTVIIHCHEFQGGALPSQLFYFVLVGGGVEKYVPISPSRYLFLEQLSWPNRHANLTISSRCVDRTGHGLIDRCWWCHHWGPQGHDLHSVSWVHWVQSSASPRAHCRTIVDKIQSSEILLIKSIIALIQLVSIKLGQIKFDSI